MSDTSHMPAAEGAAYANGYDDAWQKAQAEIASLKAQLEQKQADIERIGSVYDFAAKEAEIVLLRSERDALDKSHADLARRLADAGREIAGRRAALEACVEYWRDCEVPCPPALHDQVTTALHTPEQSTRGEK